MAVSDKAAIGFSGQAKVPILRDDDKIVRNSWAIALYLEREFPDRPSLFGGAVGEGLTQVFNVWVDRELIPAVVPALMLDVLDCMVGADAAHYRAQIEGAFKRSFEALHEGGRPLTDFRRQLQPLTRFWSRSISRRPDPSYADYVLFGVPQWARVVSLEPLFEARDPLTDWFERMLDLFRGVGRNERRAPKG